MAAPKLFLEYYGPGGEGRLAEIIDRVKTNDRLYPVTVIVPSMYAGVHLRRAIGSSCGLLNVRFMVTPRLAEYLGAPVLVAEGKSALAPIVKLAAIRHFAGEMAGREPLGAVASHPPLHEYLSRVFDELDMLSAEQLSWLEAKSPLTGQIIYWYRSFKALTRGHYDREELGFSAARAVEGGFSESALKDLGHIIFYIPGDFTPGEYAILKALGAKDILSIILGITGEEEVDGKALELAGRLVPVMGEAAAGTASEKASPFESHIMVAPDPQEEIRWAVRNIMHHAEKGVVFNRMAVLYPGSEPYAELVANQLKLAGIPASGPDPMPLKDSVAGKLLLGLIGVFESGFSRESLIRWVAESPVKTRSGDGSALRQAALWEEISGKAGITGGAGQWLKRLERYTVDAGKRIRWPGFYREEGSELALARRKTSFDAACELKVFIKELTESNPPADGAGWKEFSAWAVKALEKYASPESWPAEEEARYDRVVAAVGDLARIEIIEPEGVSFAGFLQALRDTLKGGSGRLGATGEGVFSGTLKTAEGMGFEVIHILGMAEGSFPPRARDDAVIPDSLRSEMGNFSPLKLKHHRRIEERRIFKTVTSIPGKCFFSFARSGGTGSRYSYPASWLIREAGVLYRARCDSSVKEAGLNPVNASNLEQMAAEPWLTVVSSTYHSLSGLGTLVPADLHDYDMHSLALWHRAGKPLKEHLLYTGDGDRRQSLKAEMSRRSKAFTAWDGNLSAMSGASPLLGISGEKPRSPTQLECWAKCPFSYYLRYILGIEIFEKPEEIISISALDRGSLVHRILERFIRTLCQTGSLPGYGEGWKGCHRELLEQIAGEEFDEVEACGITGRPLLWKVVKEEILNDLRKFLQKDDEMRAEMNSSPVKVEWKFGFGEEDTAPAVEIEFDQGRKVSFRGVIDRIDADAGGLNALVIDYKTGSDYGYSKMKEDPLANGTRLQLPVYALAAAGLFEPGCDIRAAYWLISSRGGFRRKEIECSPELVRQFGQFVEVIVSGIENGIFPANPGGEDCPNCEYCDYRQICPVDGWISRERKSGDSLVSGYMKMTGDETGGEERR